MCGENMRVLIVSDTHGVHTNLESVIETQGPFDRMIHLGDSEVDVEILSQIANCPVDVVAGNMDRDPILPIEQVIEVGGYRILICHGHRANVNAGLLRLEYMAREREVDIVMYGHTHVPYLEQYDDMIILNPGSLSYPRPWGAQASYAVMKIDETGEIEIIHHYLK